MLGQDEASDAKAEPINFNKMRIKQLRIFLQERGLECKGCAEKSDFVKMATENEDTPVVKVKKPTNTQQSGGNDGGSFGGDTNVEDLLAQMKKMGMNGNVFTKDDMEKMNQDGKGYEEMFKNTGTGGASAKKTRAKKAKTKNTKKAEDKADAEAKEQGSETIEL